MPFYITSILLCALLAPLCLAQTPSYAPITTPSELSLHPHPITLPATTLEQLDAQKWLGKLFVVDHIIPLELTAESILSEVADYLFAHDTFYIIDDKFGPVYTFDRQGKFNGLLGHMGWGPGEYAQASEIHRVFDGNLAVVDEMQGRIHLYSPQGSYLFSTPKPGDQTANLHFGGPGLVWSHRERMFVVNFQGSQEKSPQWHARLEVIYEQKNAIKALVPNGTFGTRFTYTNGAIPFHNAIAEIDGLIWLGSPVSSELLILDSQGHRVKELERNCRMTFSQAAYQEAENQHDHKQLQRFEILGCRSAFEFVQLGQLVLVNQATGGIFLYDVNGHAIGRPKGYLSDIGLHLRSFDKKLAAIMQVDDLHKPHYTQERDALDAIGLTLDQLADSNPLIRIGKLPGLE